MNIDSQKQLDTLKNLALSKSNSTKVEKKSDIKSGQKKEAPHKVHDKVELSKQSLQKSKQQEIKNISPTATKVVGSRFVNKPAIFFYRWL